MRKMSAKGERQVVRLQPEVPPRRGGSGICKKNRVFFLKSFGPPFTKPILRIPFYGVVHIRMSKDSSQMCKQSEMSFRPVKFRKHSRESDKKDTSTTFRFNTIRRKFPQQSSGLTVG
ncbi:hypothetical protein CDAR_607401 [Caerostris darwini]|uniref:Uncharacterized protein n=1 Tax=Caerostris darwini TaxID=1538125 RepID=A0AAV4RGK5_9ARAC|nr:hypothetical protein CDAR_607401 [Caerostris darwini]